MIIWEMPLNMKSPRPNPYSVAWLWSIGLMCVVSNVDATTYYVATNGSDSNPGSQVSPWLTINHASSMVSAGDTVYVLAGNYLEVVNVTTTGTSGNPIT